MACKRSPVRSRLPPPETRLDSRIRSPSSRGLGHRPFTAVTGVRIPVGTPLKPGLPEPRSAAAASSVAHSWSGEGRAVGPEVKHAERGAQESHCARSPGARGSAAKSICPRLSPSSVIAHFSSCLVARRDGTVTLLSQHGLASFSARECQLRVGRRERRARCVYRSNRSRIMQFRRCAPTS
jgi:hypothetical protein